MMARTLIDVFLEAVARRGSDALFLRHGSAGWESIAAERALADVESFGLGLAAAGIQRGDRVALLSENRYEWPVTDLATLGIGAILVPIYPTLTAAQVETILRKCGATVLVVSSAEQLAKVRPLSLPELRTIVVMDTTPLDRARERAWGELHEQGAESRRRDPLAFRKHMHDVAGEDVATIIYTSGTTGEPKGVMLTHANILSNVDAALSLVDLGPSDTALSFLPLCHIFERMGGLYAMLRAGARVAYARSIDTVAQDVLQVKPTIINGVPRFYEKVHARVLDTAARLSPLQRRLFHWGLRQGIERARDHFDGRERGGLALRLADLLVLRKVREKMGGNLRVCISGGAALAPETMEFFFAIGVPVLEGYGLTETSPVICLNRPGQERPGTVGQPIPGVEIRIGEQGEILTRGPHVMRGYFQDERATCEAIQDGWFHTGDVGKIDADGRLTITDRIKDLLCLAGGKKVAPQPIEARLKKSPFIQEAVLLGDRRPYVVCLIAPDMTAMEARARADGWALLSRDGLAGAPEARRLIEEEVQAVNATLAPFETIKRIAVLPGELTQENGALTATLKVRRRVVAERYAKEIESLYAGHEIPNGR